MTDWRGWSMRWPCVSTYRVRVGDYRIVYSVVASALVVEVVRVGHRREVYRR